LPGMNSWISLHVSKIIAFPTLRTKHFSISVLMEPLTKCVRHSFTWGTSNQPSAHEIPCPLWTPVFRYSVHKIHRHWTNLNQSQPELSFLYSFFAIWPSFSSLNLLMYISWFLKRCFHSHDKYYSMTNAEIFHICLSLKNRTSWALNCVSAIPVPGHGGL
jgi:hypothetical protein